MIYDVECCEISRPIVGIINRVTVADRLMVGGDIEAARSHLAAARSALEAHFWTVESLGQKLAEVTRLLEVER